MVKSNFPPLSLRVLFLFPRANHKLHSLGRLFRHFICKYKGMHKSQVSCINADIKRFDIKRFGEERKQQIIWVCILQYHVWWWCIFAYDSFYNYIYIMSVRISRKADLWFSLGIAKWESEKQKWKTTCTTHFYIFLEHLA